jgi:hypothetical protein
MAGWVVLIGGSCRLSLGVIRLLKRRGERWVWFLGGEKHVVGRNWKRGRRMRWILGERTN